MLAQMSDRGPDSAGVAVYRDPAPPGWSKLTLYAADPASTGTRVAAVSRRLRRRRGAAVRARHAVFVVEADAEEAEAWVREQHPRAARDERRAGDRDLQGGRPAARRSPSSSALADFQGTHGARAHAHGDREPRHDRGLASVLDRARPLPRPQRLALEPQPAARDLRREGIEFQTENDTEVAAGYLAWRLREGASLEQALEGCLDDLDGFYTFAVGTADGFAVLRDPIACKPAVLAETDDWVAMASEYRAIAVLPGADDARMWEPEPGVVYAWEKALA